MIEALWYGIVVSLSFIGFISVIYIVLLHIYSPAKYGDLVVSLSENLTKPELYDAVYGLRLHKALSGIGNADDLILLKSGSEVIYVYEVSGLAVQTDGYERLTFDEYLLKIKQED